MADVTTELEYTSGSGTLVVPANVFEIILEGIGGGGGGATTGFLQNGMGGGGAAAAQTVLAVTPGQTIAWTVGAGGAATQAGTATTAGLQGQSPAMVAAPGSGATGTTGGAGGTVAASVGTVRNAGSNGRTVGGASGAGGAAASVGSLVGGAEKASPSGSVGNAPGGGGTSGNTNGSTGGAGAAGKLKLIYTVYDKVAVGPYVQTVTTSGLNSWRAPLTGKVLMQAVAGGGGGRGGVPLASGGAGGGGGELADIVVDVIEGQRYDIVIGSGGTAGIYNASNGGNGADTTVAKASDGIVFLRAKGGLGGTNTAVGAGGTGGTGTNLSRGYDGTAPPAAEAFAGGLGGSGARPLGGGPSDNPGQNAGKPGKAPGGGGSGGGANTGGVGGAGAPGALRVSYISVIGKLKIPGVGSKEISDFEKVVSGQKNKLEAYTVTGGVAKAIRASIPKVDERLLPYPSWVTETYRPYFDRATGLFKPAENPNLKAALATQSKTMSIVTVGDSLTEGFTYLNSLPPFNFEADRANSYPMKIRANLAAQLTGASVAGTGMVRAQGAVGSRDPRWTVSGTGDGGHFVQIDAGSAYAEFTSDLAGTIVNLEVLQGGGVVGVSIDGGALAYTATDTSGTPKRISYTGLANTTHTVRVTSGAGSVFLVAAEVTKVNGIRVHNVAQGGATAKGTGQPSWTAPGATSMLNTFGDMAVLNGGPCTVATIMISANDFGGSSAKDYDGVAAAVQQIGEKFDVPGTDVVMFTVPHGSAQFASPAGYSIPMYERLYAMCLAKGWTIIDAEFLTGGFEYLAGYGYTGDVYGHFNAAGATYIGGLLTPALIAAGA